MVGSLMQYGIPGRVCRRLIGMAAAVAAATVTPWPSAIANGGSTGIAVGAGTDVDVPMAGNAAAQEYHLPQNQHRQQQQQPPQAQHGNSNSNSNNDSHMMADSTASSHMGVASALFALLARATGDVQPTPSFAAALAPASASTFTPHQAISLLSMLLQLPPHHPQPHPHSNQDHGNQLQQQQQHVHVYPQIQRYHHLLQQQQQQQGGLVEHPPSGLPPSLASAAAAASASFLLPNASSSAAGAALGRSPLASVAAGRGWSASGPHGGRPDRQTEMITSLATTAASTTPVSAAATLPTATIAEASAAAPLAATATETASSAARDHGVQTYIMQQSTHAGDTIDATTASVAAPPVVTATAANNRKTNTNTNDDHNRRRTKPPPFTLPAILYLPSDVNVLSGYQCLLRQQVQIFQATPADVTTSTSRMNRVIHVGQVGFRCRHCAKEAEWKKAPGSVYYPAGLNMAYQVGQNLSKNHLLKGCSAIPDEVRQELLRLRAEKSRASAGKVYWKNAALHMGVYEDESRGGGLFLRDDHDGRRNSKKDGDDDETAGGGTTAGKTE
mmetsp:Transcript_20621/g.58661  ORF Transcript_20621/g.58661 Transcript_20621/m.58661 type:complete len:558 (+) Transcript_20621:373-2046(+)